MPNSSGDTWSKCPTAEAEAGRPRWIQAIDRLAPLGLVLVLLVLPGFAVWTAVATYRAGMATEQGARISAAFEEARYAVGAEESLERKYRLEPSSEIRAQHHAEGNRLVRSLERANDLGGSDAIHSDILALHAQYQAAVDRLFDAADAGNIALTKKIDETEADPAFDSIQTQVFAAAIGSRADALHHLTELDRIQTRVLIATPIVFLIGITLIFFFWGILRAYRRRAFDGLLREAVAGRNREQRFRALVQNTADVILICDPSSAVTYQSPAAETAWGFAAGGLLAQELLAMVQPDTRPALRALWDQLQEDAGSTRSTELLLQDGADAWRHVQMILTNLLDQPAIAGVVVTIRDIQERKAFERQLTQQAFYDSLTGLPNRALFNDRLDQALVRSSRRGSQVGLVFLDLDNFKLINDSLGHPVGDELLMEVAARLQSCIRNEDTVARLGGDEFVIVLEDLAGEAGALLVANAIVTQFGRTFRLDGRDLRVSVSMGIALGDTSLGSADTILRNADAAMYRAKSDGKARYVVFDASMHTDALARLELESDLGRAVLDGELRVHYQPIVPMTLGSIDEVEALVRWQHPTRGLVMPADFISVAEETGLIVPIGQWVLEEACRQVAIWHGQFYSSPPLMLSVNLSPRQFQLPSLVDNVARTLRDTGLPPHCLKLEITEGILMQDVEATIVTLWQLKELGVKIAIDDFGTGYSSLSYLKRLPLDVLKIDRSFVSGLGQKPEDAAIVRAIISLAKSLDLSVTGEGIETPEQAELLAEWGCDNGQGYYYGRPLNDVGTATLLSGSENRKHVAPSPSAFDDRLSAAIAKVE